MKTILRLILLFLGIVLIALICYVAYVFLTYYRVEDNLPLEVEETPANPMPKPPSSLVTRTN